MGEHELETDEPEPAEEPGQPSLPAEDIDLEVGWDEKGHNAGKVGGLPVEDSSEPIDWLEEGDVVAQ